VDFSVLEFRKEGPKNYRAFFPHLQYDSVNTIQIREKEVPDAIAHSGSDDHKELYPPNKFKAALHGTLGGEKGEEVYNYLFPFNMYSSSADTVVSRLFKKGLAITDQHRDTYHTYENEPLQGPFTNTHVGGNQYRHISLNKGEKENLPERNRDGRLDDDEIRPEGWRIKFDKPIAGAGGGAGDAAKATVANVLQFLNAADNSQFRIRVPKEAGGTGETVVIQMTDADSTGVDASLGSNSIGIGVSGIVPLNAANAQTIAGQIIAAINNGTDGAALTVGSDLSTGIAGLTAAAGSGTDGKITLTATNAGAAGNSITISNIAGSIGQASSLAGGSDGNNNRLKLVSPDFDGADKPRASYLRDETAKRPVNIRNIPYTTASQDLGNFNKNYQVVMTSGRNINNHYFKENIGVSVTGSRSAVVSGTFDFTLPDRSTDAYKTRTVIAERFSAPGEPATLSRGYLDLESESFSAYNSLNFRNSVVRRALRTMLTASSVGFGLSDDLETIANNVEKKDPFRRATFHKVNKNSAKRIELKELNPDGNPASSAAPPVSAKAIDCIDTAGVGSDTKFTILVPTTAGGASSSTATIIFLDADQTTNPVEGVNEIAIGINGVSDANIAASIISAINGTSPAHANVDYASSGVGTSGVQGVTATQGSTTTKITLTIDRAGTVGNLTNAITTTVAGSHDIVDLRTFSGGGNFGFGGDDNYQTGSVSDNYYVQHQIPQSVMQYAWITASAVSGPFGFEKPNTAYASMASDDITFVSESDFGIINQASTTNNVANTGRANHVGFTSNRVSAGATKAKAAMVFAAAATADETIRLVSTDGTARTYTAKASSDFPNNQFAVGSSATDSAENLKDAINHGNGHSGKILAARVGTQVSLVQVVAGEEGNTIIVEGFGATNSVAVGGDGITGNRFTGGASSILKQPLVPLNILRGLNESSLKNDNTLSFIPNPEFTQTGEDAYNALGIASVLNTNLGSIGGAYGYPSWKQWRVGEHPVARYHKKNNIISFSVKQSVIDKDAFLASEENVYSFKEAPIMSKFQPLVHRLKLKVGGSIDVKSSYGNNLQIGLNQTVAINKASDSTVNTLEKVNFKDLNNISDSGPTPMVFEERGDQVYDDLKDLYLTQKVPPDFNPLSLPTVQKPAVKPITSFMYSETIFPKQKNAYLAKVRSRNNYTQNVSDISSIKLGQQRTFWKDAHIDRIRNDVDTTLNSLGFKIDKDATKGFPQSIINLPADTSVSGGILVVNRSNPSPATHISASGGSAALSVWPLDTDGDGSAVYGYASDDNEARSPDHAPKYYIGRGAGELSNSDDWSLYYRDFQPTASVGYNFVQQLIFSGAYQSNETGGSFGNFNKSPKLPTYQTPELTGFKPWFNSYEDYSQDVRVMGKDYSIIPEFNMSEHFDDIISGKESLIDYRTYENLLELEGANTTEKVPPGPNGTDTLVTGSTYNNSFVEVLSKEFFDTYQVTEPMNYYRKFRKDHLLNENLQIKPNIFSLSFDGIMKLLPYQGFYPVNRTVQLASLFKDCFSEIGPEDANNYPAKPDGLRNEATRTAALMQPWFNPGILFNSIKSGIAVDWPVFKGGYGIEVGEDTSSTRGSGFISGSTANPTVNDVTTHGGPNYRIGFESLYSPRCQIPASGALDQGKIIHLGPQWNQYGYKSTIFNTGSNVMPGGGVFEPATVTFTFTGTPTNGRKIGIESLDGFRITGTIDTSTSTYATASNTTSPNHELVIPMGGVSTTTDVANRFYLFLRQAFGVTDTDNSGLTIKSLYAYQDDNVVTLYAARGSSANGRDITDGEGTIIDNVTISNSNKFAGGQQARESFFDLKSDAKIDPRFRYAMNNFLAEIPNFFLEQKPVAGVGKSGLTSFISKPSNQFASFKGGSKYYMDIVLSKNKDMVMFEGPAAFQMPGSRVNLTSSARGMHYGPALRWTSDSNASNKTGNGDAYMRNMADPAFAAYTPPYFYGTSFARLTFDPKVAQNGIINNEGISFALEDIQAATTVEYFNRCERHPEFAQLPSDLAETHDSKATPNTGIYKGSFKTPASASFMHLSSSINIAGKVSNVILKNKNSPNNVLGGFGVMEIQADDENPRWVISPKFECPVLNFSGNVGPAKGTADGSLTNAQRAAFDSKGMWYGSGSNPTSGDGIVMELRDSFPDSDDPEKASLADALGFNANERKQIGKIADSKYISEAIVAIPIDPNGNFYPLDKTTYAVILRNILNGDPDILGAKGLAELYPDTSSELITDGDEFNMQAYLTNDIEKTSVGEMIRRMSQYIIPPHLDFRNPNLYNHETQEGSIEPFAMYILEVRHKLDREDLQNIWQNVMPKISERAKKVNRTITHQVGMPHEFFPNGLPDEDIRFIIFKVKKRAHNNYVATTPELNQFENPALGINTAFLDPLNLERESHLQYSYNWPYDFCSLVELGKLDAAVQFEPTAKHSIEGIAGGVKGLEYPLKKYYDQQITSKD